MTPQQRIERAHATIVRTPELSVFSSLVMLGDAVLDPTLPTAATDGRNIVYGTSFVESLTDAELVFVAMHEALHIGYRHLITWDKIWREDAQLANAACDYVINLVLYDLTQVRNDKGELILKNKIAFPMKDGERNGLLDEKYRGMSAGEVYKLLKEEDQQQQQQQQQGSGQGNGQQQTQTPLRQQIQKQQFDEHDFEAATELSKEEKEELSDNVDRAMRQGMKAAEKINGTVPRELKELLVPEVNWREVLADFVYNAVSKEPELTTYRRMNRKVAGMGAYDVYLPSYYSERISKVVVAVDLSGSVFHLAEKFMAEVMKVCSDVTPEELHVLYWDSSVRRHETYSPDQYSLLNTLTKPAGGGGTDVRCVPDFMRANALVNVDCVIVLTDGEFFYGQGDWGDTPVLWCVITPYDKQFTPAVGSKVAVKV
jgi:predicted metal-dependent peptidase